MTAVRKFAIGCIAVFLLCQWISAQETASAVVPPLVNFSGKAIDSQGKPIIGASGATFAIYKEQTEGSALWVETQNVHTDAKGNYIVQLGATKSKGLPLDLFSTGEARWLGVTIDGGQELPRVLLLSVPYALKAADAETVGGLPASAFVLANQTPPSSNASQTLSGPVAVSRNATANSPVTGKGTLNFIPMWNSTSDIISSTIFQKSSQIGIATKTPAATLDVNGRGDVRDTLTLFPKGTDPTLAISGTSFQVDQTGMMTFVSGQKFPGAGTITGVTAGADLTGGGHSGNVTLNLDTTKVPQLNSVNTFTGNQGVIGTVTVSGSLGVGTTGPQASLDVFSSTAGVHDPIGKFGSIGTGDCNSLVTYTGSGSVEIFQAGSANCFIPGAVPGDSGVRVLPGNRILLGDVSANRVLIDDAGNVEQKISAGGMVKAILHFSPFSGGRVISCFNSTLSGAAATTPPCGFTYDITGSGDYIFDFGFEVDNRVYSATPGTQFEGIEAVQFVANACGIQDGQCIHNSVLTKNQVEVAVYQVEGGGFQDSKVHLVIY